MTELSDYLTSESCEMNSPTHPAEGRVTFVARLGRSPSKYLLSAVIFAAVGGCSMLAPAYTASLENTDRLIRAGLAPTKVGTFSAQAPARNVSISVRGKTMTPSQGTYAAYLADAIRQDLELARLLNPAANSEISGVLLKNDMDGAGTGVIEARIIVRVGARVRFDKIKAAEHRWQARYLDAIPRAQQEYAVLVRTLVSELFIDPEFIAALK
jgi:hypothetical protein